MSILKFTDGVQFNTRGELRLERRHDGWYVVGEGKLIPVKDSEEGNRIINNIKKRK